MWRNRLKVGQVGQGLDSWGCPRRILTGNNSKVKAVCQARLLMNDAGSTLTKLNGYKFHTFLLAGPTGGAKFSTGRITMWSFLGVLQGGVINQSGLLVQCAH